jgi:mRNA (2'-O-methyladenosine-N6-)-methyltransferase
MDPPWNEYTQRYLSVNMQLKEHQQPWTLDEMKQLPIDKMSDTPSFLFMWCGS